MVAFYVYKILRENLKETPSFTINDVPATWKSQVQACLDDYCTSLGSPAPSETEE